MQKCIIDHCIPNVFMTQTYKSIKTSIEQDIKKHNFLDSIIKYTLCP